MAFPAAVLLAGLLCGGKPLAADSGAALELVADGMTAPIALQSHPGTGGLLIADQAGLIYAIDETGEKREEPFLDLRDDLAIRDSFDERGLLGLALHPEFDDNGRFFVYYSAPLRDGADEDWNHTSRISEFALDGEDAYRADRESEVVLMEIDQPQFNHNGGTIVFGPDGYLYISVGDGGGGGDRGTGHPPEGNGQDYTTLLGSILRIDVDGERPYGIPADNPLIGTEGRDEIYAYGLRNVWGMSFDRGGEGYFFAADVGQNLFETVNLVQRGGNYGWNIREGFHCFDPRNASTPPEDCPEVGARGELLIDPIVEYKNLRGFPDDSGAYGISVVGGMVYRGTEIPGLYGKYVFADWSRAWGQADGVMLVASPPSGYVMGRWDVAPLDLESDSEGRVGEYVLALGEDSAGELYVMTSGRNEPTGETGKLFKLVPASE